MNEPRQDRVDPLCAEGDLDRLASFVRERRPLFVLTGAGCSTESGIPAYRDVNGAWRHAPPMLISEFRKRAAARRRYWARSAVGWPRLGTALPNAAHDALARLERAGHVQTLVTQNVDRLHQKAGSLRVVDLHGRVDRVICLGCHSRSSRAALQDRLIALNPWFDFGSRRGLRPDGDSSWLPDSQIVDFQVPACPHCRGVLKPDVVFFGESVPRARVARAFRQLGRSRGVLVAGSSLMVLSGLRFCRAAIASGIPVAAINLGTTRMDADLVFKLPRSCGATLRHLAVALGC